MELERLALAFDGLIGRVDDAGDGHALEKKQDSDQLFNDGSVIYVYEKLSSLRDP